MELHYFQRYHGKENAVTANLGLLFSRVYHYSPEKFYQIMFGTDGLCELGGEEKPELKILLQQKTSKSVLDACICQESFKIAIETKLWDWFGKEQLENHLCCFSDEKIKILLTIAPELMDKKKKDLVEKEISEYNCRRKQDEGKNYTNVVHINVTFEGVIEKIRDAFSDNDFEMQEIIDDYEECCCHDQLIVGHDKWKYMRMQLAGISYDYNLESGVYYDRDYRKFKAHQYLALYKNKAVRAVGKIQAIIGCKKMDDGKYFYEEIEGEVTEERKNKIQEAIEHAKNEYGWMLDSHNYFFVDKFYETEFVKVSKGSAMGTRIFDLSGLIGLKEKIDISAEEVASKLNGKSWQ